MLLCSAASLEAQNRTPWGDPDIQGVWSNQNPVPLERPDALKGKSTLTAAEAAEFEKTSLDRLLKNFESDVPISGELNGIWLETAKGKVAPSRATSLVVDPPDGKVPYTPEGRKRWDATPKLGPPLPANRPEDRALPERCITTDGLLAAESLLQQRAPDRAGAGIRGDSHGDDARGPRHPAGPAAAARRGRPGCTLGDSRGRWEGQTLVVETTNFNDKKLFRGATRQMQLVERFTRLDADTIEYRLTVTDPATFSRPWTIENGLRKADGDLYEVGCHEGNYGMRGILSGARAEEAR